MKSLLSILQKLEFKVFLYTILYIIFLNSIQYGILYSFSSFFSSQYLYLINFVGLAVILIPIGLIYIRFKKNVANKNIFYWKQIIVIILSLLVFKILIDPILNFHTIIDENTLTSIDKSDIPFKYKFSYVLSFSILTPIIEELFFRGILLEELISKKRRGAIIYSSFLFTLIHINSFKIVDISIETLIVAFLIGVITAFIYVVSRNIYYCIVFHILNNIFSFLIFHIYNSEYVTIINHLSFNYKYWLIISVSGILFLFLINKFKLMTKNS